VAIFDPERGAVVVRIVYDGPPRAGKTTSVRSLGRSLLRSVETPLESAGRTLFFDWMEYTGGLFDGHQIRCQIVSVPGQPNLAPRRRAILREADAVVFVADTGDPQSVERSRDYVTGVTRMLRAEANPPVGVVVQANKRDLPTAVPAPLLRERLGDAVSGVAITHSVAHEGEGVRETFVFAVRLALDRVRELTARGALPRGRPSVESAEDLLKALEPHGSKSIVPSDVDASAALEDVPLAAAVRAPDLPDARVPSGAIWPPVDGRLVLHEATSFEQRARRLGAGDWVAGIGTGWRIQSPAAASYPDLESGRRALLEWARVHAALAGALSPNRCVVLAATGEEGWRLWQIVRVTSTLQERLEETARRAGTSELLDALVTAAHTLAEGMRTGRAHGLVASLDTVDVTPRGAQFVGLMPPVRPLDPAAAPDDDARAVDLVSIFVHRDLPERLAELRAVVRAGWAPSLRDERAAMLADRLLSGGARWNLSDPEGVAR
jgi:signal recognition particle receptor subunit beta